MIKFNCLIHKETGTVIKYEDWLEEVQKQPGATDKPVEKEISKKEKLIYRPKQTLFSDNFIIVYDSEFTTEELKLLHQGLSYKIWDKIATKIHEREYIKSNYNIDL